MLELNKIYNMDCIYGMKQIDDNSVDSIVTDPPYDLTSQRVYSKVKDIREIKGEGVLADNIKNNTAYGSLCKGFMGKQWDGTGIAFKKELWKEAYRILKPGGYLLSFGGTRTYHRMASAIEDAGFEIRDMIEWVYGSGFPKSLNIGKALDKKLGNERKVIGYGLSGSKETHNTYNMHYEEGKTKSLMGGEYNITKGTSEFEGFGTALKPAHEPICMARKPLSERTVVENCLKFGTGGINIDDSIIEIDKSKETDGRVGTDEVRGEKKGLNSTSIFGCTEKGVQMYKKQGRFPANLIHDNSEEVKSCFPNESSRFFKSCELTYEDITSLYYCAKASKGERNKGCEDLEEKAFPDRKDLDSANVPQNRSKNPKSNFHPTVKPIKLMEYLVKLVTRKDGIVLDPFVGSGTTAVACAKNGYDFIGFEKEKEYIEIINARLKPYIAQTRLFKEE